MKKKIFIWTADIDQLLSSNTKDHLRIGGILIQMYMWSITFLKNGWNVYSHTTLKENNWKKIDDISFIKYPKVRFINPVISALYIFYSYAGFDLMLF